MTEQEFEAIYTDKLQPKQRPVLKEFLQNKSDKTIAKSLKQVVLADSSVKLEQVLEFKLLSTGLVKRYQHGITSSCRLYRDYFVEKFRD